MKLFFRLSWMMLATTRRPALGPLDTSVVTFRALPHDLDFNGHLTNGRYLMFMDLGSLDLIIRTGQGRLAFRRGWKPIVGAAMIDFRKSIKPFSSFEVHSRCVAWNDKHFFIEQRFRVKERVVAGAIVKGLFLSKDGVVPPATILGALGLPLESPPMPASVAKWIESEAALG